MPPVRPDLLGVRHQKVQRLRRLLSRRSARVSERAFVLEGAKLLQEALSAGAPVESVYVAAGTREPAVDEAFAAGIRVYELDPATLERVADTVTPQPVMAVAPWLDVPLDEIRRETFVLVAVDVRDPGNAGTLLRTAEAAGA
ncbi:MAG TPA: RNA methyltransferase substrate-binding domain-containing protein, partial [Acidimicrobiales bacterium]|nr:RNA methyltransferase substrate-binding domain-containing protein [Acidimicrobiales bacterium]